MGALDADTAVAPAGTPGAYTAKVHDDWAIWGPNGGYIASILFRAMAAESPLTRPASFTCQYLGVAAFDAVDLQVTIARAAKRAVALHATMTQAGAPIASAMGWFVAGDLTALEHDAAPPPEVPDPLSVPTLEERAPRNFGTFPFWQNVENRPLAWLDEPEWLAREPSEPRNAGWFRFRPQATFADPAVDACRLLVMLDTMQWPAATLAYRADEVTHIAPSLDLTVVFHRLAPAEEFLLVEARAPIATGGLVGGTAAAWAGGRLLATSSQQMLCRPAPPRG